MRSPTAVSTNPTRSAPPATARGWISDALLYSATKPGDAYFCPWCIADGAAVRLFGGSFNEVDDGVADDEAARIVSERTPNFETWQDWYWPAHCGVPGIYRGQPSGEEIRAYPEALAALLADLSSTTGGATTSTWPTSSTGSAVGTSRTSSSVHRARSRWSCGTPTDDTASVWSERLSLSPGSERPLGPRHGHS
jgi:uncharacterized protein CbrC (UPF0167 family)